MPGNRPSNTIIAEKLDPYRLGTLVAFYEHSVFTQGMVWGINPFDQWGVELGKKLATHREPYLSRGAPSPAFDASTNTLIDELTAGIDHEDDQ
jgi:glucose-6-phosphate isomerase